METSVVECEIPISYVGKTLVSHNWAKAFAKGCKGSIHFNKQYQGGSIAMFGDETLLKIKNQAIEASQNWFYGDKAYFGRGKYYRVTKNAYMHDAQGVATSARFDKLNIQVQNWKVGDRILICPQSNDFHVRHGLTQSQWVAQVKKTLSNYTDRDIIIHTKTSGDAEMMFRMRLKNVWATIVYSSMAGVQSVMHGVPCFATDCTSTAAQFGSTDLSLIETPIKPDNREMMAWVLADNQFTLEELASGMAWEKVK